jgi:hypothetical protein
MESKSWMRVRWTQWLTSVGDGAFYVVSAALLLRMGFSAGHVGVVLSLVWGVAMIATPLLGRLADRVGLRAGVLGLPVLVAAGLLVVATSSSGAWTSAGLLVYAVGQAGLGGVRQALLVPLAASTGRSATTERANLQAIGNAGIALGAGLGGAALATGSLDALRGVLVLDAGLFLASVAVLRVLPNLPPVDSADSAAAGRPGPRYLALTACAGLMYLYMPLLSVGLPLVIGTRDDAPDWVIAVLFGLNTLGVLALQRPVAQRVTSRDQARRHARRGAALMASSCLLFWVALSAVDWPWVLAGLLLAVGVQVVAEVTFASGAWDLGYRMAPPVAAGTWQGTFAAAVPASRCIGPALLAWLLVTGGLWGFAVLALLFLGAGLGMSVLGARPQIEDRASDARNDTELDACTGSPTPSRRP